MSNQTKPDLLGKHFLFTHDVYSYPMPGDESIVLQYLQHEGDHDKPEFKANDIIKLTTWQRINKDTIQYKGKVFKPSYQNEKFPYSLNDYVIDNDILNVFKNNGPLILQSSENEQIRSEQSVNKYEDIHDNAEKN